MLGGATLGIVLAVPGASAAAHLWGWRPTFVALAILALVAAAAVVAVVVPATQPLTATAATPPGRRSLRPVLALTGLGGLLLVGHFAAFTFVAPLVAGPARALPGGVSGLLLLFGVLSGIGVLVVGRVGDRRPVAALVTSAGLVAAALAGLAALGAHPAVDVLLLATWGLASGALPALLQTAVMRAAGRELRSTAGTLIPVTLNLGIAVGAAAGSAVVGRYGVAALPTPAGAVALVAAVGLAVTTGLVSSRRPQRRPVRTPLGAQARR